MKKLQGKKAGKKKWGNRIVLAALLGMLAQSTVVPVVASNFLDTGFTFVFTGEEQEWESTRERLKEDNTSVYMKCIEASEEGDYYYAYVWGWRESDNWERELSLGPAKFYQGTTKKMVNWVYEYNYDYAFIRATTRGECAGRFWGAWSPDSI